MKTHEPTVVLGVTGGIAAYKACGIIRGLQKEGMRVKVVMTQHATEFVGPATFRALTGEAVALNLFGDPTSPIRHVSLAQEADVFCIAPCTANVLNKLAHGVADDLLTSTALTTKAPLLVCPSMNTAMWRAEQTQDSVGVLKGRGIRVIEPESGYLACGDEGEGRLASLDIIIDAIVKELRRARDLEGKRILITAGPTREALDPIRYISSPSSGLTGFFLAEEAVRRGAEVTLIFGPVGLSDPYGAKTIRVRTACEMLEAAKAAFEGVDAAICAAAVTDFRPVEQAGAKIKKGRDIPEGKDFVVRLVPNPDILATLAAEKARIGGIRPVYLVGFAAETEDLENAAKAKLKAKHVDLIVANDVSQPGIGFASTCNQVLFVDEKGVERTEVITKRELASRILDRVAAHLQDETS